MYALNPLRHSRRRRRRWELWVFRCPTILGHSFLIAYNGVIIVLIIRDQMVIIEVLILVFLDNQVFPRDKLLLLREGLREGCSWNQWGQIWWGPLSVEDQGVYLLLNWLGSWRLRLLFLLLLLLMRIGGHSRPVIRWRRIIIYLLLWFMTHLLLRSPIEDSLNVFWCGPLIKRFPEEYRFIVQDVGKVNVLLIIWLVDLVLQLSW